MGTQVTRPATPSNGQPTTSATQDGWLPAGPPGPVREALAGVEDFAFHFDQPAFYAVLEWVRTPEGAAYLTRAPLNVEEWTDLLAMPGEYRGRAITIQGRLGRNKTFRLLTRPELGTLGQLELWRPGVPVTCTVVCTEDVSDLAVDSAVTITGCFVMVHQYYGSDGRPRQSALLVARGPTMVSTTAPPQPRSRPGQMYGVAASVLGAGLIAWLLLRRVGRRPVSSVHTLRARRPAPVNLSGELARWAEQEPPPAGEDPPRTDSGP